LNKDSSGVCLTAAINIYTTPEGKTSAALCCCARGMGMNQLLLVGKSRRNGQWLNKNAIVEHFFTAVTTGKQCGGTHCAMGLFQASGFNQLEMQVPFLARFAQNKGYCSGFDL